jgi:hypothetical protein
VADAAKTSEDIRKTGNNVTRLRVRERNIFFTAFNYFP